MKISYERCANVYTVLSVMLVTNVPNMSVAYNNDGLQLSRYSICLLIQTPVAEDM